LIECYESSSVLYRAKYIIKMRHNFVICYITFFIMHFSRRYLFTFYLTSIFGWWNSNDPDITCLRMFRVTHEWTTNISELIPPILKCKRKSKLLDILWHNSPLSLDNLLLFIWSIHPNTEKLTYVTWAESHDHV